MLLQQRLPVGPRDAWRGKTKENPEQSGGFSSFGECCFSNVCRSVRATPGAVKPKKTRNKVEGFLHSANAASATFAGHSANAA